MSIKAKAETNKEVKEEGTKLEFKNIYEKMVYIQSKLKAPKTQWNPQGFHYRNCDDIYTGLKPLLNDTKTMVVVTDSIKFIEGRFYIEAKAKLIDSASGEAIESIAYAREEETRRGMAASQLTGATSSYARKYRLNGLFAIDDTKDVDTETDEENTDDPKEKEEKTITDKQANRLYAIARKKGFTKEQVDQAVIKNLNKNTNDMVRKEYEWIVEGYEKLPDKR